MEFNINWSFLQAFYGEQVNANQLHPAHVSRHINQFGNSRLYNQLWGVKDAVWIDTTKAYRHYLEIPELRAVIDKRASMMATARPVLKNYEGEIIESHWIYDLIDKPNPLQNWSDVIYSLSINDALYSTSFAYCPKRIGGVRNLIVPLPSHKMEIILTGKRLKQMDVDGIIGGFKFNYDSGDIDQLTLEEIVYLCTTDGINIVDPVSRLESLKYPLSNLKAAYHKRNVLLENIGAIGILSAKKSDLGGAIPMTPEEKKEIQMDWYRRSKDELIITESEVDWKPMSYPTKDLMLFEEMNADKLAIIDAYGLNSNLFSSEKGSTFTNVRDSIRMVYTDTIIPETEQMYSNLSQQLGLTNDKLYLCPEFGHLKVLQDDEEKSSATMKTKAETLEKLISLNLFTPEEIKILVGLQNIQ
jgi:hypothetical protein